jgi:hypothetical protein
MGLPVGACLLSQGAHEGFLHTRVAPNFAVEPTPYSLRFAAASRRGSPRAFGFKSVGDSGMGQWCAGRNSGYDALYIPLPCV